MYYINSLNQLSESNPSVAAQIEPLFSVIFSVEAILSGF